MKFALCNETLGHLPLGEAFAAAAAMGYTGTEIAPKTLLGPGSTLRDVRSLASEERRRVRRLAEGAGLEVVGLHWLLAETEGFHLTTPDPAVRAATGAYLAALAVLCADLGGRVLVLGSPGQRNLIPGVTHAEGEENAADTIRFATETLERLGVVLALEPLGPEEGNFLLTADAAVALARRVGSPAVGLHLDIKAMATEGRPIPEIVREHGPHALHFHANDPNRLGPGMGDAPLAPILDALARSGYEGWVSVEPFRYEPTAEDVARVSIENLRAAQPAAV